MIRAVKYILCTILTLCITLGMILLPYAYFDISDSNAMSNYKKYTFSSAQSEADLMIDDLYSLFYSGTAMWLDYDGPSDSECYSKAVTALKTMKDCFSDGSYGAVLLDTILSTNWNIVNFETKVLSGAVKDTPVSIPMFYFELSAYNEYALELLVDLRTNLIYQLTAFCPDENVYRAYHQYDNSYAYEKVRVNMVEALNNYYEYSSCSFDFEDNKAEILLFPEPYSNITGSISEYGSEDSY